MNKNRNSILVWKEPFLLWAILGGSALLLLVIFFDGLKDMVGIWEHKEEYGHGFLLPVISILLILQNKDKLERIQFTGSWLGMLVVLFGVLLFLRVR